jgi:hypothetical protein
MSSNHQVQTALVKWIKARTAVETIFSHQSGKAPALPYIMVNFMGLFEVRDHEQDIEYSEGADPVGPDLPPITARPVIESEWRFSVHAYGTDPTDILRPLVAASKLAQVMEPMMPGLVIHEISQIRNVPDWINEGWQPRAQADVVIRGLTKDGSLSST